MTYYGRWTYKFEMAQKMGAAGALIVHETGPAGYAFSVVQVKTGEQFDIARPDGNMTRAAVEGWIPLEKAKALFAMAGQGLRRARRRARRRASSGRCRSASRRRSRCKNTLRTRHVAQRRREGRGQRPER